MRTTSEAGSVDTERLLADAEARLREGDTPAAQEICHQLLHDRADLPLAHALLGVILAVQGLLADAVAAFGRALALDQSLLAARFNRATVLVRIGRHHEALDDLDVVVGTGRELAVEAARLRVRVYWDLGQPADALDAAEASLEKFAHDPALRSLRGRALRELGRLTEAAAVQDAVLAEHPDHLPALCERGWVLLLQKRPQDACDVFDAVLEHDESNAAALSGIGLAMLELGMPRAALAALDKAVATAPDFHSLFNRALALQELRRYAEALEAYEVVLQHWPDNASAFLNISTIRRLAGELDAAETMVRRSVELCPEQPEFRSVLLYTLLYKSEQSPESLAREHREWGIRHGSPAGRFTHWPNERSPDRRLRLGILSAELRQHVTATWLLPALESLDRSAFSVTCYHNAGQKDELSAEVEQLVDDWRDVYHLDDRELALQIRRDGIDILVETTGHGSNNRLTCLALRPAPVQATWLGYPFTTGLDAIDYFITDAASVPADQEPLFAESIVRLPGGRFCFRPPAHLPPVVAPPCLTSGPVTFGSFNNIAKLTPEVIALWCRILEEVPQSRLLLKAGSLSDPTVVARIRGAFGAGGVSDERLELRGGSPYRELLRQYGDIDVALDPFPFTGGGTTFDALMMGVPVVTLASWQPISRQTASILAAIGCTEWVAHDADSYVRIAAELARDRLRLGDLRAEQRDALFSSPLCDERRMGRELGAALRMMWEHYCAAAAQA